MVYSEKEKCCENYRRMQLITRKKLHEIERIWSKFFQFHAVFRKKLAKK